MGDFNPNSPNPLGTETYHTKSRQIALNSPLTAVAMRVLPGATTVDRFHQLFTSVNGTPGLAIEQLDSIDAPDVNATIFYPGTDTNNLVAGWVDQAGGAVNFGDLDDAYSSATYARTSFPLNSLARPIIFSGDDAGALAGERILGVNVGCTVLWPFVAGNFALNLNMAIRINSVYYNLGNYSIAFANNMRAIIVDPTSPNTQAVAAQNPETGLPWTVADIDAFLTPADTDAFGLSAYGSSSVTGWPRIGSIYLLVVHCTENRKARHIQAGAPRAGWTEYTPTDTAATSADTHEWVLVSCPRAGSGRSAILPVIGGESVEAVAGSDDAEHRVAYLCQLTHAGGVVQSAQKLTGEQIPLLLSNTINPNSQPYASVANFDAKAGALLVGQQITAPGVETYGGVKVAAGWTTSKPERPLTVEVRSGVGAISGGGTLVASGSLDPDAVPNGTVRTVQINFDTPFTSSAIQYHVLFSSEAAHGWALTLRDTRSDFIGTGTTLAEIEGASQGGQTDSYVQGGTEFDRYDLSLSLIATPDAPANFTATPVEAEVDEHGHTKVPPRVVCSWDATALGASFGGYRVWRRPRRTPAEPWTEWCAIAAGDDPAVTEANETEAVDYMAGWGVTGARYEAGWDYTVTVVDGPTALESDPSEVDDVANVVPSTSATYITHDSWVTSNEAPWLNVPLRAGPGPGADPFSDREVFENVAGRPHSLVLVTGDTPGRTYHLREIRRPATPDGSQPNEDILRIWRAAARSGREMALLQSRGDLAYGKLGPPGTDHGDRTAMGAEADFVTTSQHPPVCGYNLPPGMVLDGTTDFLSVPDHADLDPASDPFTLILYASIPDGSSTAVSKGNLGTADGFGFTADGSDTITFAVDGADASGGPSADGYTGARHVFSGASDGSAQTLHVDEVQVATSSVTHGAISNAIALVIGANNAGASGFAALDFSALALYRRVLTDAEQKAAARYLRGWAGYRMPTGAVLFLDVRDERSWDGTGAVVLDLAGSRHHASVTGAPARRGTAWSLAELETSD